MFSTAVLTASLCSQSRHSTWRSHPPKNKTSLVCIIHAVRAKSSHLEGFLINASLVTISDDVFPLYLAYSLIIRKAEIVLGRILTFWKRHTFLITLQRAGYFCCRKFFSRLKSRIRLEAELCAADLGCSRQLTLALKNICVAVCLPVFSFLGAKTESHPPVWFIWNMHR